METNRFDSLVKSLANGASRRSVLKGLVGLGGAAAVTSAFLEPEANAARRPTPTPKPITCPAGKHWDGTQCVCTTGGACGPECCHVGTECCDNACCFGHCYGEELCCPYENWCAAASECCAAGETCCDEQGCILIEDGDCGCDGACPDGFERCGSQCCAHGYCAGTTCCAIGVCGDACLVNEGDLCCGIQPYDPQVSYCCDGTLSAGECCTFEACEAGFECCNDDCCPAGHCASEGCCAGAACGNHCMDEANEGCCAGMIYQLEGNVCCDGVVTQGGCCDDEICGTCSRCVNHRCTQASC